MICIYLRTDDLTFLGHITSYENECVNLHLFNYSKCLFMNTSNIISYKVEFSTGVTLTTKQLL